MAGDVNAATKTNNVVYERAIFSEKASSLNENKIATSKRERQTDASKTGCSLNELLLASEPDELCLISRKNRCARLTCSYFSRISKEPIR